VGDNGTWEIGYREMVDYVGDSGTGEIVYNREREGYVGVRGLQDVG